MNLSVSENGRRVIDLIKAVRTAGVIMSGAKIPMPDERPAAYVGPVMDGGIQMHKFQLFDGVEVVLEVPALDPKPEQVALLVSCEVAEPASH